MLQQKGRVSPPKMFSQRNNPYCDLLHFSVTKLENKLEKAMEVKGFLIIFDRNINYVL